MSTATWAFDFQKIKATNCDFIMKRICEGNPFFTGLGASSRYRHKCMCTSAYSFLWSRCTVFQPCPFGLFSALPWSGGRTNGSSSKSWGQTIPSHSMFVGVRTKGHCRQQIALVPKPSAFVHFPSAVVLLCSLVLVFYIWKWNTWFSVGALAALLRFSL